MMHPVSKAPHRLALGCCTGSSVAVALLLATPAAAQEACFERLDNGVDLTGWSPSPTNMHGPGQGWTVEDGTIVGRQTDGQQGGILVTDASYQDVEVVLEVKIDWGCDSGLFFRTTDGNRAYQVTIDHVSDSAVGTIWGEAFPQELREIPYLLTDDGNTAVLAPDRHEEPIFDLALWPSLWDPTAFNEIRARIEDNPPHMQVWISGTQVMDFTETILRDDVNASGPLAIQVHGGSRWISGGTVAFRNIRVRDLSVPCDEMPGGDGAGGQPQQGAGGSGGNPAQAGEGGAPSEDGGGGAGGSSVDAPTEGTGGVTDPAVEGAAGAGAEEPVAGDPSGSPSGAPNPGAPGADPPGAASGAPIPQGSSGATPPSPSTTPTMSGTGDGTPPAGNPPPQETTAGAGDPSLGSTTDDGGCGCRLVGRFDSPDTESLRNESLRNEALRNVSAQGVHRAERSWFFVLLAGAALCRRRRAPRAS